MKWWINTPNMCSDVNERQNLKVCGAFLNNTRTTCRVTVWPTQLLLVIHMDKKINVIKKVIFF